MRIQQINEAIDHVDANLDFVEDDPEIPESLTYYINRGSILSSVFIRLIYLLIGAYLVTSDQWYISILCLGLALYKFNFQRLKNLNNKAPQLVIGNDGIDLKFNEFGPVPWSQTEDITVDTETGVLILSIWNKEEFFNINFPLFDLNVYDYDDFLRIINVYLKRNHDSINKRQKQ